MAALAGIFLIVAYVHVGASPLRMTTGLVTGYWLLDIAITLDLPQATDPR